MSFWLLSRKRSVAPRMKEGYITSRATQRAVTARIRQSEIDSCMCLCLNICRHNTAVMRGVFSLLHDAFVNGARVMSILCIYEDVYSFSLPCIYMFKLLDTKFFNFLMSPYLMVFMGMYNCLGLDVGCV